MKLLFFFFFKDTATTEICTTEDTLSLHDALPIRACPPAACPPQSSMRSAGSWRSEEHTSELQSPSVISYAVFCLKKQKQTVPLKEYKTLRLIKTAHTTYKH